VKHLAVTRPRLRFRRGVDRGIGREPDRPDPPQAEEADGFDTPTVGTPEADDSPPTTGAAHAPPRRHSRWKPAVTFAVLPALSIALAGGAGYLKWAKGSSQVVAAAAAQSVAAAAQSTVAMLTYKPDTVAKDLTAAGDRLTGAFKNSYLSLTHDVVIPGSRQKRITATATVPAAASVSATDSHAVVLVFVNQTVTIGGDAPSDTASSVKVTLDRVDGRWLISGFDPI